MNCHKCGKEIGTDEGNPAYQVRVGCIDEDGETFLPDEDVGYYCKECLAKGV